MIKLSEIENKYKDYLVDEDKLKEILVAPKSKTVWDLEEGDVYYYLNNTGRVCVDAFALVPKDYNRRGHCNVFLTEEEAQLESDRRECESLLLKYGRRTFKYHEPNWFLYFNYIENQVDVSFNVSFSFPGLIYFDSEELARKAMESLTEYRLKKYILGIEPKKED